MNLFRVLAKITVLAATISAAGTRPGGVEAYLMLARSDFFRIQLLQKLGISNRSTLQQRIKNGNFRVALKNAMRTNAHASSATKNKSNKRLNRFKNYHQ